jgi:PAS domain S-box-containing protein
MHERPPETTHFPAARLRAALAPCDATAGERHAHAATSLPDMTQSSSASATGSHPAALARNASSAGSRFTGEPSRFLIRASDPAPVERTADHRASPAAGLHALAACDHCREHALPLAQRYERIYMAVEQTGDSVVITDRNGVIEYVNPSFERTTGYTADEVVGQTPRLLKSGVHEPGFYAEIWSGLLSGTPFRGTIVNRKKGGELYSAEQTISPIRDASGTITAFVSVLKDITLLLRGKEQECLLRLAREIQQRFYTAAGVLEGFDLHAVALPASETGGDYFDFLPAGGGMAAVLADVSGHGFSAALVMSETRAYCRAFATIHGDCTEILERVNERLFSDLGGAAFATMAMLHIMPREKTVVFSGAGHVPGVLVSADGTTRLLRSRGLPLGLFADAKIKTGEAFRLESGDTVALMTDGITESASPEGDEFGLARAIEVIASVRSRSARDITSALVGAAISHAQGQSQIDDIAVLVCRAE